MRFNIWPKFCELKTVLHLHISYITSELCNNCNILRPFPWQKQISLTVSIYAPHCLHRQSRRPLWPVLSYRTYCHLLFSIKRFLRGLQPARYIQSLYIRNTVSILQCLYKNVTLHDVRKHIISCNPPARNIQSFTNKTRRLNISFFSLLSHI